jgi:hypothetical protein
VLVVQSFAVAWGEVRDDPMVQPHVERGPAGWVLVTIARRPDDLLVVGAGRRGALPRMAFARVARYCVARAQCPVLAVPPPAVARELGPGRLAWAYRHRPLTAEQILRDPHRPAARAVRTHRCPGGCAHSARPAVGGMKL